MDSKIYKSFYEELNKTYIKFENNNKLIDMLEKNQSESLLLSGDIDPLISQKINALRKKYFVSKYARKNINEFLAESFTEAKLSENPSEISVEVLNLIDKYFKK